MRRIRDQARLRPAKLSPFGKYAPAAGTWHFGHRVEGIALSPLARRLQHIP
jgi:hypothetical protein